MIRFFVPGNPRGKGRPRFSGGHAYTDSETKAYENKIKACYQMVAKGYRFPDNASLLVEVTAVYGIPKSATKAAKASMEANQTRPHNKPDLEYVIKAVLDALNGVAYKDDSRVVGIYSQKVYGDDPKLIITIKEVI